MSVPAPAALPGFSNIRRYWDPTRSRHAAKILPGEFYVTTSSELLVTVLGSCVSACVWDPQAEVGGMNHFMLPEGSPGGRFSDDVLDRATRYGYFAMEHLINSVLKGGAWRSRLLIKLAGGAQMFGQQVAVGESNIEFVRKYVAMEGLRLVGEHVGGHEPRKVVFDPRDGRVRVKRLRNLRNDTIKQREVSYRKRLKNSDRISHNVELFED
ncbi:MAG: chemoreceptor glutamine deamidase CheD [Pseudomonadota bacterium]